MKRVSGVTGIPRDSISHPQVGDKKHQQYQGMQQGGIACGLSCPNCKGQTQQTKEHPFHRCLRWGSKAP